MKISEADLFEKIEAFLADYPICQYGFLKSEDILFSDKVRYICEKECPRYGKSWSCPPAVGEVADCKKHCISYQYALVFTTLSEVEDIDDMEETLATRPEHEEVVHAICQELEQLSEAYFALSSESCAICSQCAYPESCRHPEHMIPCIESQGILVTDAAEKCGIEYFYDRHTVTWYGIIFFHHDQKSC
ncbi:MAG: DUF2284 domain-containing protein [Hominisplanchenecus sp.]|jgi:predicted metal-binding protein|uniref:DUF2284 domain-containing protein n=1 Tax=Clostridia TaxID=186801 RepID=UPI000EDECEC1|nr:MULTISPECIES: DUF2284 domain-containing protein [Clostridia]MCF7629021.1 DUF2284 domain-containing protein [[Ruminococcus] lactaris]MCM0703583.1 DUF2284 domain-containing protein [Faecalicatena sp. BF-R-105]HAJ39135.1 metal-binding protein [Lachnospiraceae bacterium]MBT9654122.1 DUF2284 domain-containing protein [Ruminococcus sp. MCC718]NSD75901.1 DUF2284 domain-containing protein [Faecalicatena fissicatena]